MCTLPSTYLCNDLGAGVIGENDRGKKNPYSALGVTLGLTTFLIGPVPLIMCTHTLHVWGTRALPLAINSP